MQRWFVTVGSALLLLVGAPESARADTPKPPEPAKSADPPKPPEPAKSADPPKPPEPAKSTDPPKPPEPAKSADPVKSPEPVKSADPPKPPEPVKSTEPVKPPEPVKSTEPVKPPEPVKSTEPVKPPEPVKSPEPVKPPEAAKPPEPVKPPEAVKPPEPPKVVDPDQVRGTYRKAVRPNRFWGMVAAGLLFIPRKTVELIFLASGTTAGLIRDQQVVPRVEEVLSPQSGEITIFPTIFAASRQRTSAGVRALARLDPLAISLGFGIGGPNDINGEARFRYGLKKPLPFLIDVEGLYDNRSTLKYYGIGQNPSRDCRNHFTNLGVDRECDGKSRFRTASIEPLALYMERRARAIVSIGVRPGANFEIFASSSFLYSALKDSPDAASSALSKLFVPGTVPYSDGTVHQFYTEFALRYDTRLTSGRPSAGALVEGYGGLARGTGDDNSAYVRVGGRAAAYIPILRQVNILSPKIVIDALVPALGESVPFTALVTQPDFRGYDIRRDLVSTVISLDYRWSLMRYLAARVFVDAATVAPKLYRLFETAPRFAAGFGFDLFSESALLGQFAAAFSADGVTFLISFGLPAGFGDRQHRY